MCVEAHSFVKRVGPIAQPCERGCNNQITSLTNVRNNAMPRPGTLKGPVHQNKRLLLTYHGFSHFGPSCQWSRQKFRIAPISEEGRGRQALREEHQNLDRLSETGARDTALCRPFGECVRRLVSCSERAAQPQASTTEH